MPVSSLFKSVPDDFMGLYDRPGRLNSQKVVGFLELTQKDVANAIGIPKASVRYDQKIPKALLDRVQEWAVALNLVATFFNDHNKTQLWFKTPNPLLGNISPRDMIRYGRYTRLMRFVLDAQNQAGSAGGKT